MKISKRHKSIFFALLPVLLSLFLSIPPTLAQQPPIINSFNPPIDGATGLTWNRPNLGHTNLYYDTISKRDVCGVLGLVNGNNDGIHTTDNPPTISITSPNSGSTVEGTVTISATASDDFWVEKVEFYVDNSLVNTDTSSPWSYAWDTTAETNGEHKIRVVAYDSINQDDEDEITVIVQNFAKISITSLDIPSDVTTGEEFTVYATIANSGTIDAKSVTATIHLPVSMVLTSDSATQTVGTMSKGGSITVSWTVRAERAGKTTGGIISTPIEQTESINVTITSSNAGSNSENGSTVVKPSPTYQIVYTTVLGLPVIAFAAILIVIPIVAFFGIRYIISRREWEDIRPRRLIIQKTQFASPQNGDFFEGLNYFEQGNYQQAIESFQQSVKIKPGLEDAWYFMGLAYEELENQEKAIEAFETVVNLDLERVDAWDHLARGYFALEKPKKALECLEKVVNFNPEDADAWYGMGTISKSLGWTAKAENYFGKAIEIDPRYSEEISWPEKLPEIHPEYLTVEPSTITSCPFCSETIPSGVENCPTCGEKAVKCPICMKPIESGDEFVKCPNCSTLAHRSHLLEWIKIKGICPVCRTILKDIDVLS